MDANQETLRNPFGMDEDCRNCPALCETRQRVVHGFGDVAADFCFVGERPDPGADAAGVPFAGDDGRDLWRLLGRLGLCPDPEAAPDDLELENTFLTHLTRCRDPDRAPTDEEVRNCEAFLTAEVRMINPEVLVPVGERPLRTLATEYTTTPAAEFSLPGDHASEFRGRGFALFPTVAPGEATAEQLDEFGEAFGELMGRDYRQTKGRRSR